MASSAITYRQGQNYDSSIPKYPAPCPVAPYRRSNSATLTGYRSIYRTRSGFGDEEEENAEIPVLGDPEGTHWHPDQRFVSRIFFIRETVQGQCTQPPREYTQYTLYILIISFFYMC